VAGYLAGLPPGDPLLRDYEWWVVPHINPDGEALNRSWYGDDDAAYDLPRYLAGRVRELPGDDIEFGFPVHEDDREARPEPRAVHRWWQTDPRPFVLHVSLHGMGFAAGPWFLIDRSWRDRCDLLKERCATEVAARGYTLHDVERRGEKGFVRLGRGFCTRPDSRYMREHFLALGDEETASRFRPSSMETARRFGGDTLTLVTEMPLFITPGVGEALGPPDPVAVEWKERIEGWRLQLQDEDGVAAVTAAALASGMRAMPVRDQMVLQWTMIAAGLASQRP